MSFVLFFNHLSDTKYISLRKLEFNFRFFLKESASYISLKTGCKKPCKYRKFRIGEPKKLPFNGNQTDGLMLWSMADEKMVSKLFRSKSSSILQVETEQLIYPLTSLVAEFGGCLGLFMGFSFMTIWDLFIALKYLTPSRIFSL